MSFYSIYLPRSPEFLDNANVHDSLFAIAFLRPVLSACAFSYCSHYRVSVYYVYCYCVKLRDVRMRSLRALTVLAFR